MIPSLGIEKGLALMTGDKRLIFVLPWREKFTLVGTTESRYEGEDFAKVPPSDAEIRYLLDSFNEFFPNRNLKLEEVRHIYSGVRTLLKGDGSISTLSREQEVRVLSDAPGTAWVMLYGGKLTSHRSYAVQIVKQLRGLVAPSAGRERGLDTALEPLPGGGTEPASRPVPPGIASEQIEVWRKRYGSRWPRIRQRVETKPATGAVLVPSHRFTQADLEHMVDEELALTVEDITLRRTKMAYDITPEEEARLAAALAAYTGVRSARAAPAAAARAGRGA